MNLRHIAAVAAAAATLTALTATAHAAAPTVTIDAASHDTTSAVPFTAGTTRLIAVSGAFTGLDDTTGHHTANRLAILNGTRTRVLWTGPAVDGWVQSAAAHPYGGTKAMLYVGGNFTHVAGQPRNHLAAFTVDTASGHLTVTLSGAWLPSSTVDVESLSVGGGRVYFPTGSGVRAVSLYNGRTVWQTSADCGVHAVYYHAGYVYLGGMFVSVRHGAGATLRVHGIARVRAAGGAVDMSYHAALQANDATCHQPARGHDRYSGTNAWAFTWTPRGLAFGGAGIRNAFGVVSPAGRMLILHALDGDGQTVAYSPHCLCLYVGHHRSGGALKRWPKWIYDWGSMGGLFRISDGREIHWRYDTAFTGGNNWNGDARGDGAIASFVAWGVLCVGGSFTRPAHGLFCTTAP